MIAPSNFVTVWVGGDGFVAFFFFKLLLGVVEEVWVMMKICSVGSTFLHTYNKIIKCLNGFHCYDEIEDCGSPSNIDSKLLTLFDFQVDSRLKES